MEEKKGRKRAITNQTENREKKGNSKPNRKKREERTMINLTKKG
jgi:hypothetical protein